MRLLPLETACDQIRPAVDELVKEVAKARRNIGM